MAALALLTTTALAGVVALATGHAQAHAQTPPQQVRPFAIDDTLPQAASDPAGLVGVPVKAANEPASATAATIGGDDGGLGWGDVGIVGVLLCVGLIAVVILGGRAPHSRLGPDEPWEL